MSSSLPLNLREIFTRPAESRYDLYKSSIDSSIQKKNLSALVEIAEHLISKEGSDQYGRTYITGDLLSYMVHSIEDKDEKLPEPIDVDLVIPVLEKIVEWLRPKRDDFVDSLMDTCWLLSQCYEAVENAKGAAAILASFKLDEKCSANAERRVLWYVTTAQFYLEADDAGSASMHIKPAYALINDVKDPRLLFNFKLTYARALDWEKKFLEAALRYMEISQTAVGVFDEEKMNKALECAITCAILAKAGPNRSRVLAMLYSDERAQPLPNFAMLEKMFKERIIRPAELSQFVKLLQDHQNAETQGGKTIPQVAVIEHNVLAVAKLYQNISFDQLAVLLNISTKEAESLAAKMIEQGRMKATIDQIENVLEFDHTGNAQSASSAANVGGGGGSALLSEWDAHIYDLCQIINRLTDQIAAKHPQFKI